VLREEAELTQQVSAEETREKSKEDQSVIQLEEDMAIQVLNFKTQNNNKRIYDK
jgi:hypothetical protein